MSSGFAYASRTTLNVIWQVLAFAVCIGAFALVMWDGMLRERRSARAKLLGLVAIACVAGGGFASATDHWWGVLLVVPAAAACELGRRFDQNAPIPHRT